MPSIRTNKAQSDALAKVDAYLSDLAAIQKCIAAGWPGDMSIQFKTDTGRKGTMQITLAEGDKDIQPIVKTLAARQKRICKDIRAIARRHCLVLSDKEEALVATGEGDRVDVAEPPQQQDPQPAKTQQCLHSEEATEEAAPSGGSDFGETF